jgi:hypothetical protein
MSFAREGARIEKTEQGGRAEPTDRFLSNSEKELLREPEMSPEIRERINQILEQIASGESRSYDLVCDHIMRAENLIKKELTCAAQLCYWKKCRLKGESLAKFYFASGERRDDNVDFCNELLIEAAKEMILPFAVAGLYHSDANELRRLFIRKPNKEFLETIVGLSGDLVNDRDFNDNLKGLLEYLKRKNPRNLAVSVAYHIVDELNQKPPSVSVLNYLVDTFTFLFHNGGSFIETIDGGSIKPALVIGGKWSVDSENDPQRSKAVLLKMMDPEDQMRAINGLGVSRSVLSRSENLTDEDIIASAAPGLVAMPGMVGLDSEVVNKMRRRGSGFTQEQKECLAYHLNKIKGAKYQPVVTDPLRYVDAGETFDEEIEWIRQQDLVLDTDERVRRAYGGAYYAEATKISRLMEDLNYFDFEVAHELRSVDIDSLEEDEVMVVRRLYQDISNMENMPYQKFIDWHDKEGRDSVKIGKLLRLSGHKKVRIGESPVVLISYFTKKGERVNAAYTTLVGESFGYFYINGSQVSDVEQVRRYLNLPVAVKEYLREGE